MFDSKKLRESARQQAGETLKQALDAKLAEYLRIEDPVERYVAVLDFRRDLGDIIETAQKRGKDKKEGTCTWAGLAASAPIAIAWIAMEPFTGVMHLAVTATGALFPGVLFKGLFARGTRIGDSHLKDAQVIVDQAHAFQCRAQEALETIAKNHLDEIAVSPLAADLRRGSSLLDKAMAEAFSAAARKRLENPEPPKPKKEPGFNL